MFNIYLVSLFNQIDKHDCNSKGATASVRYYKATLL